MLLMTNVLIYTPIVFLILYFLVNFIARTPKNVCVVVLGDIGRSPRMQYHTLSLAKEGYKVFLVAYKGSTPLKSLLENESIFFHCISEPPAFFQKLPRLLGYVLKVIWQSVTLAWVLLLMPKVSSILVQNPPSVPTLPVAYVVSCVRFCELVMDWHNYGHTIMAMTLNPSHFLVRNYKWCEKFYGHRSSFNLCVTRAMEKDLFDNWGINAVNVYDRPPDIFKSVGLEEQHQLFEKLSRDYPVFSARNGSGTVCTIKDDKGKVRRQEHRPAILVSSTSWTVDEDFGILLAALEEYDQAQDGDNASPRLVCIITGKGPQKEFYRQKIEGKQWRKVQFCLPWLEAEDYPVLLGSADIGVCLHSSSSGLDLPMKVVDMFGCGVPVCALNFQCIGELVRHEHNGLVFDDSTQLVQQLRDLLQGFPNTSTKLKKFRQNLSSFQATRWHDQWSQRVLPIFEEIGERLSFRQHRTSMPVPGLALNSRLPKDFDSIGQEHPGGGKTDKKNN